MFKLLYIAQCLNSCKKLGEVLLQIKCAYFATITFKSIAKVCFELHLAFPY